MPEDRKLLREVWIVWALLVISTIVVIAFPLARVWGEEAPKFEPTDLQIQLHEEAQRHRIAQGRERQTLDADLCKLCQKHAEWQARSGRMFHGSGENCVAYGTTTAPSTVRMWINSPPHRAFLMGGGTLAGWGHAVSPGGTHYWAAAFRGASRQTVSYASGGRSRGRLFRRK